MTIICIRLSRVVKPVDNLETTHTYLFRSGWESLLEETVQKEGAAPFKFPGGSVSAPDNFQNESLADMSPQTSNSKE